MLFKPRRDTIPKRVVKSVQIAVMLAAGIIAGGLIAYSIGQGARVGANDLKSRSGFVEEGDARFRSERLQAMKKPVVATDTLSVASRSAARARPKIAIIIDDIGLNRRAFDRLILTEGPLTFSILPYAPDAQTYADLAHRAGHDVMLHLPMAPEGLDRSDSAGPNTLRLADGTSHLITKLKQNLDEFDGYAGVNNHMGSGLTTDPVRMKAILQELAKRELYFVDSITTSDTAVENASVMLGEPYFKRDLFLDSDYADVTESSVADQLMILEAIAKHQGYAIGIGHPYASTIAAIDDWMARDNKSYDLVSASELVEFLKSGGEALEDVPEEKRENLAQLR